MFTGIIESIGQVTNIVRKNDNFHISLKSDITNELKIDQSIAHNGICLTVVNIANDEYTVIAIKETMRKTNLQTLKIGDLVNLERAMILNSRIDGHIVQGHVDQIGRCIDKISENGSYIFTFEYDSLNNNITIEKGSITINGVSLTVVNSKKNSFSVAIIPYTYEHTVFKTFVIGTIVNLEFDIIGKYVAKLLKK